MKDLIIKDNLLEEWIKNVVFKYCPVVDDRFDLLHTYKCPEIDIDIFLDSNESSISFCFGSSILKTSTPERADINRLISLKEIINLIDFLIEDHEVVSLFDFKKIQGNIFDGTYELLMTFSINWSDKSLQGLSVGTINLKINFGKDYKIAKDYVIRILNRYKSILEKSESYRKVKQNYFSQIKREYFKMLGKQELLNFISEMNETEIRNLLFEIDNDIFECYFNNFNKSDIVKDYRRTNK